MLDPQVFDSHVYAGPNHKRCHGVVGVYCDGSTRCIDGDVAKGDFERARQLNCHVGAKGYRVASTSGGSYGVANGAGSGVFRCAIC